MENILEIEQFDTSVLSDPIMGEDNEIVGYFTSEDADDYFSDPEAQYSAMAAELTYLMNQVEASGFVGSNEDGNPDMERISEIASILSWFKPELLDKRFG
jgi:hypothetical protein